MYSFKDYPAEAAMVREAIESHCKSEGNSLLDVACGTGKHLAELANWFDAWGLDLDEELLEVAAERVSRERLLHGDMRGFDLDRRFDAITCLFSSIGYMTNSRELHQALENMARHLKPGGVLLVEPWLYPDQYQSPHLHMLTVDLDDLKIARISNGRREGDVSVIDFEYLIMTFDGPIRESERHELGLYPREQYEDAMRSVDLEVEYDPIGPMGRGLFIGTSASRN
jgi:SAM-dependent methyltransferase